MVADVGHVGFPLFRAVIVADDGCTAGCADTAAIIPVLIWFMAVDLMIPGGFIWLETVPAHPASLVHGRLRY